LFTSAGPSERKTSVINRVAREDERDDFRDWLLPRAEDKEDEEEEEAKESLKNVKKEATGREYCGALSGWPGSPQTNRPCHF